MALSSVPPSVEELDDLILSCRYGDLEDVQDFVNRFGPDALDDYADENGNSCLHMASANGHEEIVKYILNHLKKTTSIDRTNLPPGKNTPLHWAAMNHHLSILKLLCERMTTSQICKLNGRGMSAMSEAMGSAMGSNPVSNSDGRSCDQRPEASPSSDPPAPADEIPMREQCVNYLVEMMKLGEEDAEVHNQQANAPSSSLEKDKDQDSTKSVEDLNNKILKTHLDSNNDLKPVEPLR